jgi:low temperature requirement protein LtrA
MTAPSPDQPTAEEAAASVEERHATWLELFFDLVIVVAVARVAEVLHDGPGRREAFFFVVIFYAMWNVWTAFTLYANVSGDRTRVRLMLLAMFGIAIMAASVPQVLRGEPRIFIWAYIWCQLMAAGSWKRTNTVMTDWPGVQQAVGIIPWGASLGFEPPVRYYLWIAGIVLGVVVSIVRSRRPAQLLAEEQEEVDREQAWRARRDRLLRLRRRAPRPAPVLRAARPNRIHLAERLGLFVIIVLGEAVAQVIDAAAEVEHWDNALGATVVAGFGLLVALWWLTLQYGASGAPGGKGRASALRVAMPAHFLMAGSIVLIAAGLGVLAGHGGDHVPEANRWVLCLGAAVYFLTASVLGAHDGASFGWIAGWGLPAVAASVLLGFLGGPLPGWALAVIVLAIAAWHVAYRWYATRTAPVAPA